MKKIKVEDAVGMELCHDITAMRDGFKGAAFRRGHVIRQEDIPALLDLGKRTVFVWRLWLPWQEPATPSRQRGKCS